MLSEEKIHLVSEFLSKDGIKKVLKNAQKYEIVLDVSIEMTTLEQKSSAESPFQRIYFISAGSLFLSRLSLEDFKKLEEENRDLLKKILESHSLFTYLIFKERYDLVKELLKGPLSSEIRLPFTSYSNSFSLRNSFEILYPRFSKKQFNIFNKYIKIAEKNFSGPKDNLNLFYTKSLRLLLDNKKIKRASRIAKKLTRLEKFDAKELLFKITEASLESEKIVDILFKKAFDFDIDNDKLSQEEKEQILSFCFSYLYQPSVFAEDLPELNSSGKDLLRKKVLSYISKFSINKEEEILRIVDLLFSVGASSKCIKEFKEAFEKELMQTEIKRVILEKFMFYSSNDFTRASELYFKIYDSVPLGKLNIKARNSLVKGLRSTLTFTPAAIKMLSQLMVADPLLKKRIEKLSNRELLKEELEKTNLKRLKKKKRLI